MGRAGKQSEDHIIIEPRQPEPEVSIVEAMWAMSDDGLRGLLEGEFGEDFGCRLAEHLANFDDAMIRRFGLPLLLEFYARRLATHGYDADAFRALPADEQVAYVNRFADAGSSPVEH